jgi:acetyltransferase-like isoleucine patch superfamily enzyme
VWRESRGKILVGEGTSVNKNDVFFRAIGADIVIGRYCDISFNVGMFTSYGGHYVGGHKKARARPIVIGDYVWIGYGAMIRGGVTVGDGAVIGMGAVVLDDVEPYTVVAGNPAKFIKVRPDKDTVEDLVNALL